MPPSQHFVENGPECEQVAALIDLVPLDLLGRHVWDCPKDLTRTTETFDRSNAFGLNHTRRRYPRRQTKVQHLDVAIRSDHDVFGLQVPMDDARVMRCTQCLEHLPCNLEASLNRKRAPEPIAQGVSLHQLGHQIVGADVMDGADIGMIQRGDCSNLAVESLAEALPGDLDRDLAVESRIKGLVDLAHAASSQEAENLIWPQLRARDQLSDVERTSRRFQETLCSLMRRQQRLDLLAQRGVVATRFRKIRGAAVRRERQRALEGLS